MKRKNKEALQGVLYVLPSFILLIIFCIIPIFMSGWYSFTDYNVMKAPAFTGISNYVKMFRDSYFIASMKNTLIYVLVTVPLQTILSLLFAAFLASKLSKARLGGFLRSVMFIPVIASAVTAGTVWRIIFNADSGLLNSLLGVFHIPPVNWLGSKETALISICIVAIWKNVGYFLVIYYAGIMGISRDLFESSAVDGAKPLQQFRMITVPMLKPITYLVVTLGIIWSFQVFDLSYLMTGGGPGKATVTLVMSIYNSAFKQYRMGYACAQAIFLLLVVVVINVLEDKVFNRGEV